MLEGRLEVARLEEATLRRVVQARGRADQSRPGWTGRIDLGLLAARRSVLVDVGPDAPALGDTPHVIEAAPGRGSGVGLTARSLGAVLGKLVPGTTVSRVLAAGGAADPTPLPEQVDAALVVAAGRRLVLVVGDAHRDPQQREVLDRVLAAARRRWWSARGRRTTPPSRRAATSARLAVRRRACARPPRHSARSGVWRRERRRRPLAGAGRRRHCRRCRRRRERDPRGRRPRRRGRDSSGRRPGERVAAPDAAERLAALVVESGARRGGVGLPGLRTRAQAEELTGRIPRSRGSGRGLRRRPDGAARSVRRRAGDHRDRGHRVGGARVGRPQDREGRRPRLLLGDEGGGYWLGREAVRAALAATTPSPDRADRLRTKSRGARRRSRAVTAGDDADCWPAWPRPCRGGGCR